MKDISRHGDSRVVLELEVQDELQDGKSRRLKRRVDLSNYSRLESDHVGDSPTGCDLTEH